MILMDSPENKAAVSGVEITPPVDADLLRQALVQIGVGCAIVDYSNWHIVFEN